MKARLEVEAETGELGALLKQVINEVITESEKRIEAIAKRAEAAALAAEVRAETIKYR